MKWNVDWFDSCFKTFSCIYFTFVTIGKYYICIDKYGVRKSYKETKVKEKYT